MTETYEIMEGESPMSHRCFKINEALFHVFDSRVAADMFRDKIEGDVNVVIRHRSVFMRRGEVALMILPNAGSGNDPRQAAAQAILTEIERLIENEKTVDGEATLIRERDVA